MAEALGYANPKNAVPKHVNEDDKLSTQIEYALIFGSKLESAKRFKHWVTSEVLPSIRKHGAYATELTIDKIINDPDFGIRLSAWLKREKRAAVPPSNKRFITVNHKLM